MNGTIYTNSVKIKIILLQKPKTTSLNQEAAKYRIVPSLKKKMEWNSRFHRFCWKFLRDASLSTNVARVQQRRRLLLPFRESLSNCWVSNREEGASLKYRQAYRIENMTNEQRLSQEKKLKVNFKRIGGRGSGGKTPDGIK